MEIAEHQGAGAKLTRDETVSLVGLALEWIAEENIDAKIVRLGITEGQFAKAGPRAKIRAYYKIDKDGIVEAVTTLMT